MGDDALELEVWVMCSDVVREWEVRVLRRVGREGQLMRSRVTKPHGYTHTS